MTNKYHASWTMFGRGYRTDLDETDPETQQLAQRIRREIALEFSRGDLQQSFGNKRNDGENKGGDKEDDIESDDNNDLPYKQINVTDQQIDVTNRPAQQPMSNQLISSAPYGSPNAIATIDEHLTTSPFAKAPSNITPTSAAFTAQTGNVTQLEVTQPAAQADRDHYQENQQQQYQRSGAGFFGGMRDKATGLLEEQGSKNKHSKGNKGKDGKL
jgi:hypothetical protein